jgi:hypothetical protein
LPGLQMSHWCPAHALLLESCLSLASEFYFMLVLLLDCKLFLSSILKFF